MNALRLMHVFPSFNPGGAELRTIRIMNALRGRAHHTVMALNGKLGARSTIDPAVTVDFISPPRAGGVGYWSALRGVIRAQRPDLLLTYNWGSIDALIASWGAPWPVLHNECGFGADEARGLKWRRVFARRILLRRVYGVAVTARTMRNLVITRFAVPETKVFWKRTGVDIDRFQPGDGRKWRESIGLPPDVPVFGFVGALRPEKNLSDLIRAFARSALTNARLVLVGDGPSRAGLEALVRELRISDFVLFPGHVPAPETVLRGIDVFVMSSSTEATPNSLLEAMSCGLPVVSTDVGDVREVLGAQADESLVALGDLAGYSAALTRWASMPAADRQRAGKANRLRVVERHSFAGMVREYESLYHAAARKEVHRPGAL